MEWTGFIYGSMEVFLLYGSIMHLVYSNDMRLDRIFYRSQEVSSYHKHIVRDMVYAQFHECIWSAIPVYGIGQDLFIEVRKFSWYYKVYHPGYGLCAVP